MGFTGSPSHLPVVSIPGHCLMTWMIFGGTSHDLGKLQLEKHGFYMDWTRPAKLVKRDFHGIQLSQMVT